MVVATKFEGAVNCALDEVESSLLHEIYNAAKTAIETNKPLFFFMWFINFNLSCNVGSTINSSVREFLNYRLPEIIPLISD